MYIIISLLLSFKKQKQINNHIQMTLMNDEGYTSFHHFLKFFLEFLYWPLKLFLQPMQQIKNQSIAYKQPQLHQIHREERKEKHRSLKLQLWFTWETVNSFHNTKRIVRRIGDTGWERNAWINIIEWHVGRKKNPQAIHNTRPFLPGLGKWYKFSQ